MTRGSLLAAVGEHPRRLRTSVARGQPRSTLGPPCPAERACSSELGSAGPDYQSSDRHGKILDQFLVGPGAEDGMKTMLGPIVTLATILAGTVAADETGHVAGRPVDFARDVLPIFRRHC